jgi:hypothetical protein
MGVKAQGLHLQFRQQQGEGKQPQISLISSRQTTASGGETRKGSAVQAIAEKDTLLISPIYAF